MVAVENYGGLMDNNARFRIEFDLKEKNNRQCMGYISQFVAEIQDDLNEKVWKEPTRSFIWRITNADKPDKYEVSVRMAEDHRILFNIHVPAHFDQRFSTADGWINPNDLVEKIYQALSK